MKRSELEALTAGQLGQFYAKLSYHAKNHFQKSQKAKAGENSRIVLDEFQIRMIRGEECLPIDEYSYNPKNH